MSSLHIAEVNRKESRDTYTLTIDGQSVVSEEVGDVINPATEEIFATYPLATRTELDAAVDAAHAAFPKWRDTPLEERQRAVRALGDVIEANYEKLVNLLIAEQGKGRAGAEWEIGGSALWCREIATQSLPEEVWAETANGRTVTRYTPIGVVAAITPWNFPLLLAVWKLAPALVAGNTVVLKPSPYTPLCTLLFGELSRDILPPGVLNVVSGGNELGQWLTEHPRVGKISFTGSTATGKLVLKSAAANMKRVTLELGGNDPAIVLPDVDAKEIAPKLFWAAFQNSAQFCVATKRLYVHADVYDDVCRELAAYAAKIIIGNGADRNTQLGPIQNIMQYEKVCDLLRDSVSEGHRLIAGGVPEDGSGYFVPVTLVDNPPDDARCVTEEAFGPVLPILKYTEIDDAVARANDTIYGLAASVWSADIAAATQVAERLEAGTVWINQIHQFSPHVPFGGHKQSGLGIENSLHGLKEYCNLQTIMSASL